MVVTQERAAHDANERGEDDNEHGPGDADGGGLLHFLLRAQAHEAHNDMRHAEVAQAPRQAAQDVLPRRENGEIPFRIPCAHAYGIHHEQGKYRSEHHGAQHKQTLEEVGPAAGFEAAHEHVANSDKRCNVHGNVRIDAGYSVKQRAACLDGACRVYGVSYQEDDGAYDLQRLAGAFEAVREVLRDGDGVVGHNREFAQAWSLENPADGVADCQAHGDPNLSHAQCINAGRKAHEHPCAHVGGASGKRGDERTHFAAAQEVFLFAAGF